MKKYVWGLLCGLLLAAPALAVEDVRTNVTFQNGATADGNGTAISVRGFDVLGLDVSITNTATVTVQGKSTTSGTYTSVPCFDRGANAASPTATSTTNMQCAISGLDSIITPISSCSSCTVTVRGQLTTASSGGAGAGGGGGGGGDGAILDGVSGSIKATVKDYTNSNPLTVVVVDTNGDAASIGGGTQYAQGSVGTTTDQVNMSGAVRKDTAAAAAGVADGDRIVLSTDSVGRLRTTSADVTQPVSGTVTVTDGAGALNVIVDSGTVTTVSTVTAVTTVGTITNPVTVTDGSGALNVICDSGCSGGTQYAEDSAHVSTDQVTMAGVVQQSADAALSSDGDRSVLQVDANGFLKVNIKAGAGSGGTAMTDDAAFTAGTTSITPMGAMFDNSSPDSVDENDAGILRMSANRNLFMNIRDAAGNERGANVNASNELQVAATGTVTANAGTNLNTSSLLTTTAHDAAFGTAGSADTQVRTVQGIASMTPLLVNPGTATNFAVYAEDSAHASGDNLILAGAVRSDAAGALAADGDRTVLQVDSNGYLKVVNINPNLAADNSTLSTAKVPVLPGTVSTSAPTWTNGNQSALSLQTDGSVRAAITNTVTVSDGSGALNVICDSGCSGGTQYAQGTAGTATDVLSMAGAVRKDTAAVDAGAADGDRVVLSTDSVGRLRVTFSDITQGVNAAQINGATTQVASNSLNTTGSGLLATALVGQCDETSPTSLTENQFGHVRLDCTSHALKIDNLSIAGTTISTGNGSVGAGVQRVTIADNSTGLLSVNPGTAANFGIYVEDAGETAGGNLMMSGSVRRDVAASSAGTTGDNATINTDSLGLLWSRTLDPCSGVAKTFLPFSITTATTTELTPSLAGASTNYYVCALNLVTANANNVALTDDDTDNCASVTSGLAGGTTAASGWNFAANGGMTFGNGQSSIFKTNGANRVLCLVTSAATQLSGSIVVVSAP